MTTEPEQDRRVTKLYTDMYEGSGPRSPSITTRLSITEDDVEKLAERQDKTEKNITWIVRLIVGTFIAAVANLIMNAVHH